jgi:O-antigen/teichoic acid export membrane protein
MNSTVTAPTDASLHTKHSATRRQIRGSSLLLVGRLLSKGVSFAVQVLIVRYLSKTDYGAFAYALSIVSLCQSLATFGLDRAITRFVPIYHEQRDYSKLFGTIVMVVSTISSLGLAMALLLHAFQGFIAQSFIEDQQAQALLLTLIFLAPVQAIDDLLVGLFAVFASPRAIFFRKYVLAPGLKLSVVLVLTLGHSTVFFLAGGYLAASAVGVAIYAVILFRILRDQGLFQHFDLLTMSMPWREVFAFTIPLLTSDLVYVVMNTMDAVVLERFGGVTDVAALRAVQPTAAMNQLVLASFATLFTPLAARMFARNDREGINNLYWQSAIWIAVFSFPIFAVTFSLAHPLTLLLYGARYEQSAIILALLSFGYYFNAALGSNGLTLKVYGKLRYIVTLNIMAAVVNLGAILLLIPRYGALGAAIGTCGTLIVHNILKQTGLRLGTGINIFDWRYFRVYLVIILSAAGLLLIQLMTSASVQVSMALAGVASLVVFMFNRRLLDISQTFPELLRIPLMRHILGR